MLLKSLRLENIRSYTTQEINFPEGSLLLWGDIGSGKSTVLSAIEFALFGIIRGQLSGGALLRHGSNTGSVELRADIDNKDVIIKRILKRAKNTINQDAGYIVVNGRKTDASAQEIRAKVLELLNYPKELLTESKSLIYRYTVYTPQEQMKHILYDKVEERLNILRKVFGIDKYKRVKENAAVLIKEMKDKKQLLKELTKDFKQRELELKEKEQEINKIKLKQQELLPKIKEMKIAINESKEKIAKFELRLKQADEIRSDIKNKESLLKEYANQVLENNKKIEALQKEIELLDDKTKDIPQISEDEINHLDRKIKSLIEKSSGIKEKIELYSKQLPKLKQEVENKTKEIEFLMNKQEEIEKLQKEVWGKEEIERKIEKLEKEVENLKATVNEANLNIRKSQNLKQEIVKLEECPTCKQEVSEQHKKNIQEEENKKITQSSKTLSDNEETLKQKQMSLADSRKQMQKINQKELAIEKSKGEIASLNQLKKELVEKQKEYSRIELERISLEKEVETAQELPKLNKELEKKREIFLLHQKLKERNQLFIEMSSNKETLKAKIGELNKEKLRLSNDLSKFKEVEELYQNQKKRHEELLGKEKELEIKDASLDKEMEGIAKLKQLIKQEISKQNGYRNNLQQLENLHDWMDNQFLNIISVIEKHVMARIYMEFNELFQQWFSILMEDENMSIRLDDEFTPIIEQNGYETTIDNLSGGEKTALALAYRLSLNKVINDIITGIKTKDLIILDEPTDGFSSEQLDKIRDVLEELQMKQTIIVSHENKIEGFVDSILKVQKAGHVSSII